MEPNSLEPPAGPFPNLNIVAEEKRKDSSQDEEKRFKKQFQRSLSFLDAYTAAGPDHGSPSHKGPSDHAVQTHDSGEHLEFVMAMLTRISAAIGIVGALILVVGCLMAFVNVSMLGLKALPLNAPSAVALGDSTRDLTLNLIRSQLGHIIVFTLEILVAADVIETLAVPIHAQSFGNLGKIAIIVAVRTCLSFFLEKELEAVDEELKHEQSAFKCPPGPAFVFADIWQFDRPPSLMLAVTCFLLSAGLMVSIAERFHRTAPIAELILLAGFVWWCHAAGSAWFLLGLGGVLAAITAMLFRFELFEYASVAINAFAAIAVPKHTWSLHQILFWGGCVSAFSWGSAWLAMHLGMQKGMERLWLALLIVGASVHAVNNIPVYRIATPACTPQSSPTFPPAAPASTADDGPAPASKKDD